ncbi:hypothetical protein LPB87_17695 [Flavobacterium sp. EDS]|nr:hypothetical protein [Flavobacterium sp. EDS]MCD0476231.1 hypothetical protein [Flavobacterium sp. EDS]
MKKMSLGFSKVAELFLLKKKIWILNNTVNQMVLARDLQLYYKTKPDL